MKSILLLLLLSFSFPSQADNPYQNLYNKELPGQRFMGTEVGNGGFVVKCANLNNESDGLYFYDVYNLYQKNKNWKPSEKLFLESQDDLDATVTSVIKNYALIDEVAASRLMNHYKTFWEKTYSASVGEPQSFILAREGSELDSNLDDECISFQIISQISRDRFRIEYYYNIFLESFILLDVVNKSAAVIHEMLYHEPTSSGRRHDQVVNLNQFILSLPDLSRLSDQEILLWQVKNTLLRAKNNFVFSQYGKYMIRLQANSYIPGLDYYGIDNKNLAIDLYETGMIKSAVLDYGSYFINKNTKISVGGRGYFDKKGNLIQAKLMNPLHITLYGKNIQCEKEVVLSSSGKVLNCY